MRTLLMAGVIVVSAVVVWAAGQAAPGFSLQDQDGKTVSLDQHKGKSIVVLEWVNPTCPYVVRHYRQKTMKDLAEAYKDKGVVWLAVNSNASFGAEATRKWRAEYGVDYPILMDGERTAAKAFGARTTPHMFVIDKGGAIAYSGAIDDDPNGKKSAGERTNYVRQALDEMLAGKPVSVPETKPYGCGVK